MTRPASPVKVTPPEVEPMPRRGPGRPPKNPLTHQKKPVPVSVPKAQSPPPVRRGPGRPPKSASTSALNNSSKSDRHPMLTRERPTQTKNELTVIPRRGPGRPPNSGVPKEQVVYERPRIQLKNRPKKPFNVRVEALSNEDDRQRMVEIFKTVFPKINLSLFREFVQPQQLNCTRRRPSFNGPFNWFIRNIDTNEIVCAASGMVHSRQFCHSFMEICYFATTASYLNMGLGRLLNAALQKFAYNAGCEYVLVQASREAVNFWTHTGIGYTHISRELMSKFMHFYEMRSIQLTDTVLLSWEVDDPITKVTNAKKRVSPLVMLD
eukprot:CAMPEP_0201516520 /NCGR_PEP_ID=MMETSP0161_2-20130828/7833_1 /ASSEMBLY_ACC=CAM_ASM_000251 /TAXON_ID=180227 /ORGANISM="Neoparamoeba aestuarina, Strain SoJaBio B1-5/56/2" /LENGTH=321 /DNA_ID=CAMNT_0047913689 /DNA_START=3 /DNA_END=965 /DNA_ORIENTATION=+